MRLAAEFEAREGRDLRGLLDFLAARAESDAEAQAATAAEGHDGVRIMTVHNAKGLEFDVVAVPDLSRGLLAGARPPVLALGREQPPRVGMQLRRLGAGAVNLYDYAELCEEASERDSEEGLRLFHVAATRARERLILSGVVKPEPGARRSRARRSIERLVEALGVERDADAAIDGAAARAAPRPRRDLPAVGDRGARQPPLARAGRGAARPTATPPASARSARDRRRWSSAGRRSSPAAPSPTPRSRAYEECAYRFYMERVLGLAPSERTLSRIGSKSAFARARRRSDAVGAGGAERPGRRRARAARVEPGERLARAAPRSWRGATPSPPGSTRARPTPRSCSGRCAAGSARRCCASEIAGATRVRAEVPILLGVGGTVLRGSIDLLVEREGAPPLVVDYKTDRLGGADPRGARRRLRDPARDLRPGRRRGLGADEVEVAYVFLERPDEPVVSSPRRRAEMAAGQRAPRARRSPGSPAASSPSPPNPSRTWALCRGCPALGRLCSGPPE